MPACSRCRSIYPGGCYVCRDDEAEQAKQEAAERDAEIERETEEEFEPQ